MTSSLRVKAMISFIVVVVVAVSVCVYRAPLDAQTSSIHLCDRRGMNRSIRYLRVSILHATGTS